MNSSSSYSDRQLKQAIEWFVRLQSEQCPAEDYHSFETWLAKNANHTAAYAEAERIWADMDNLKFVPVPGLADARSAKPPKSATALTALAIFTLTSALLGGIWIEYSAETIIYATRMGEHRRIELTDNSHIDLNTDTRIAVRVSLLQRSVALTRGEALFEVSHNRLRPFTVQVGDLRIRDVGTRFNVRTHDKGAIVSVMEGEVVLNNGQTVINEAVAAGSQRSYSEAAGLGLLETADAGKLTAWVQGQLVFKHTPLQEVTTELERYHPVHFSFVDPKLAQTTLSGTFDSHDLDPFLHALQTIMSVEAERHGQQIRLRRAQKNQTK